MKKCYSLLRWPCLLQCAQQTFTVQNKPAAVAPKETIAHHFFVSGIERRKLSMQPKNLWRRRNVVETRNPANIRKWIARFYYFEHLYSAGSACVLLTIIAWVAHRYGQLYLLLINILLGSFQLFLHSDQPLWGWNNPVQRCLPVGGRLHYPPPERVVASRTDWQTASRCATDDDQQQHHHAEHHFQL